MRRTFVSLALTLGLVLVLAGSSAAAPSLKDGALLRYGVKANVSVLGAGQTLGTWPGEGEFSVAFSPPGEDGRREIRFVIERLDIPELPGVGGSPGGALPTEAFVGKPLVLVVDARGQLVDMDLPLPEDWKTQLKAGLAASQPKTPEAPGTSFPAVSFIEGLKRLRPGTTFTFAYAAPRETGEGKDEVRLDVEFPGPNPEETSYAIDGHLTFAFALPKGGQQVNGTLLTKTRFAAEEGLLELLDLELLAKLVQEAPGEMEFGAKLTVTLDAVEPYQD
ncbi:MAG: hypothetical protein ACM3UP_01150 [Methanocella sp.]